jgi:hypothetical protein
MVLALENKQLQQATAEILFEYLNLPDEQMGFAGNRKNQSEHQRKHILGTS